MKKDGGSESTIIIDPSKSVLVHALHNLEYVIFRVLLPKILLLLLYIGRSMCSRPQYTVLNYMGGTGPSRPIKIIFGSYI